MKKVTAGRDYLGKFAPQFAGYNDDILFGEVWTRKQELPAKYRSMITIAALMGAGITDQSMGDHLKRGQENGITKTEIVELITHLAFYTGWPKGWAVFAQAMEVFDEGEETAESFKPLFDLGEAIYDDEHFNGTVHVKDYFGYEGPMIVSNVTFEPGVRNNYHIHQVGQTLMVTDGRGWYQEEGKEAQELFPGDIVTIGAGVKHWHGAAKDTWFSHLAMEDPSKGAPEWLETYDQEEYDKLP